MQSFFATMIWTGVVALAIVAVVEASVGTAIQDTAGPAIRRYAQEAAREEAQGLAPQGETTTSAWATAKDVAQTFQGWVTAIGIFAGGVWAYYTFIVGRQFSGSPEIQVQPKHIVKRRNKKGETKKAVVISVNVKNIGFTALEKQRATISIIPITEAQLDARLPRMQIVPASLDPRVSLMVVPGVPGEFPKERELFDEYVNLDSGAEAGEDVLLPFGEYPMAKVEFRFTGRIYRALPGRETRTWIARIILDIDAEI